MTHKIIDKEHIPERVRELLSMLTVKRPSGTRSEVAFCNKWLVPLGALPDEYGNHWLTIGKNSPILWSSHTDTVHKTQGIQKILYGDGIVFTDGPECLGADCTVGVWLMVNMARAGVPGTYVWHTDEEIGGRGSAYIAVHETARLEGIQFAIAFDRKGNREVITHQGGMRCCSDAFATSLIDVLKPMTYTPSSGGTFTDTASYVDLIPECTNISVGYQHQHTAKETLDVRHATALLDRVLSANWSRLTCSRNPLIADDPWDADWSKDGLDGYVKRNPMAVADFLRGNGFTQRDIEDYLYYETNADYYDNDRLYDLKNYDTRWQR